MLINLIKENLFQDYVTHTYLIPFSEGRYLETINKQANILKTDYLAEGTKITAESTPIMAQQLKQFIID